MEYGKVRNMKYIFIITIVFSLFVTPLVMAQTEDIDLSADKNLGEASSGKPSSIEYIPATHSNLSSLLWKFRTYDANDKSILSNYVRTQNCDLYKKYINDEFIWLNIVEGIKRDIKYSANTFNERLEILTVIPLGQYNFKNLAFEIRSDYALYNEGAIIFPLEDYQALGSKSNCTTMHFPGLMKFLPDNKYLLAEIPMYPEQANPMLDRIQKNPLNGYELGSRVLLARIRINVNGIHEANSNQIIFGGQLDEIAFFEDSEMKKEVWKKNFKDLE